MTELNEKQKLMILFGIFAVAGALLYYTLLLRPQFLKFVSANREFVAVKSRVKAARALIKNADNINRQYENLKKQSELLEKKFPGQEELSGLLQDFSDVAESSGASILRIKPLEVMDSASKAGSGFYYELPIIIEARAGYHQCGMFVNKLETMERFIRIDELDIKGRQDDARHHDMKIRVSTFVMR